MSDAYGFVRDDTDRDSNALERRIYFTELFRMLRELVRLQGAPPARVPSCP